MGAGGNREGNGTKGRCGLGCADLAAERQRFGNRRLDIFLRREKTEDGTLRWRVNHRRVYRL